jgi:hypothetical protein
MALTPSQRVTLVKQISDRLADEEWPLIDLTLKEFGLPTTDTWSGTKEAYLIEHVAGASDAVLMQVAAHAGYEIQGLEQPPAFEPPFWTKGQLRLFVSHLAAHRAFAGELQEALAKYGISAFVAHNDIEPTAEWQTQIETALGTCDALVALLHPNFHESRWTDQEIGYAMGRGVPVFSVRFGQDPYGFIGRFQAFNGNGKTADQLAHELFLVYLTHKQTERAVASALVGLFEKSNSFAMAKRLIGQLETLQYWETGFSGRIAAAVEANGQIEGSWGVPDRVTALIEAWKQKGV